VLVGILASNGGSATIFGTPAGTKELAHRIGYMPQETALYQDLTIRENMEVYAEIFGLTPETFTRRTDELLEFVDLLKWADEPIHTLSGGMRHRASLACAMVHSPEVLFLDEPTVGVDPELRARFWAFFNNLRSQGVTVIITTHYMDEARNCSRIGLMRNGRLIAEGLHDEILESTGTTDLEAAFLKLAARDIPGIEATPTDQTTDKGTEGGEE